MSHSVQHKGDRPRTRAAIARRNRKKRLQRAEWFREQKEGPCADCGVEHPFYVMQFDHVPGRGPKLFNMNYGAVVNKGIKVLEAEIAKCDLVCANCHATRTWERMQVETE